MSIDTMKQALEALENGSPDNYPEGARVFYDAKDALRLAIEQAERKDALDRMADAARETGLDYEPLQAERQEPVAWGMLRQREIYDCITPEEHAREPGEYTVPLYTAPPQRQPLTDEQILEAARDHYNPYQRSEISFARAIERKHGIGETK